MSCDPTAADDEPTYHVDGELVSAADATVSVRDRGFLYGDAAFEALRAYRGAVFEWEAHADRLAETCEVLHLDHGCSRADLRERIDETLAANNLTEAWIRLSITRGRESDVDSLIPAPDSDPTVVVLVGELPRGGRDGVPVWDGPATVQTVKTRRVPDRAVPARAKTHNYLEAVLERLELRVTGADEALVLDATGTVAGGAASNVFFVDDDALCTPSLQGPVRPGVTRDVVLELARSEDIPVREGSFTPDDVRDAAEVFLTNTRWEVRPVATVDGIDCGGGPLTTLLSRLFDERIEQTHYQWQREDHDEETDEDDGVADAEGVDDQWDVGDAT